MTDQSGHWPVLTRYDGDHLKEVAFPLGGIGTGTVALGGRAELRDFEILNRPAKGFNPPYTFFALRALAKPVTVTAEKPLAMCIELE